MRRIGSNVVDTHSSDEGMLFGLYFKLPYHAQRGAGRELNETPPSPAGASVCVCV
jgi:hypothetical protein